MVEEAKKATPVTVEDTPLSPEEQKMVQDFAEKIDLTNSQMILQYGAASQKKAERFFLTVRFPACAPRIWVRPANSSPS